MSNLQEQFEAVFSSIPYGDGRSILEAGVVDGVVVNEDFAKVTLVLEETSPLRESVPAKIEKQLIQLEAINRVAVEVLNEAPTAELSRPQHARSAHQPRKTAYLQNYDAVIAVASGKGGVGKSTVSVNLALALAQQGHQVSLFDADIYGPSLPIMMGMRGQRPEIRNNKLVPINAFGLDFISIGNLIDEDASTVWRGPMVHQAIEQMLRDTDWPGGDFMVIDLPPGTGDAQLTLTQVLELTGAVIVSTPQDVALLDAIKAMNMFQKVDVDIIGIVENMSLFQCPHCGNELEIFGKDGAQRTSEQMKVPFLGTIPIELDVRLGGDEGRPLMVRDQDSKAKQSFIDIAKKVISVLED